MPSYKRNRDETIVYCIYFTYQHEYVCQKETSSTIDIQK